jgi:hypothetical protein
MFISVRHVVPKMIYTKHEQCSCYIGANTSVKAEMIIPFSIRECVEVITSKESDTNLTTTVVDYLTPDDDNQLYSVISSNIYKLVWPMTDREFVFSTAGVYDSRTRSYIICMKTVNGYDTGNHIKCDALALLS